MVERVLGEIGQSLRPMAKRRGTGGILQVGRGFVIAIGDADPARLAGPAWSKYMMRSRVSRQPVWPAGSDPRSELWDYATLAGSPDAYIDDARARGDAEALAILERRAKAD